jgi:hypothetical protein
MVRPPAPHHHRRRHGAVRSVQPRRAILPGQRSAAPTRPAPSARDEARRAGPRAARASPSAASCGLAGAPREPRRASGSLSQALLWIGKSLTRVARRCAVHSTAKGRSFFMPGAMATRGPLETAAGGPRGART